MLDVTQQVENWRPRVSKRIYCPQAVDDVLQDAAIAAWRAGVDDVMYVAKVVHSKIFEAMRRGARRSNLHYDQLSDIDQANVPAREERDLSLSELADADPSDVEAALAYERGEIERTPAERKAQQRRIERIRQSVK